VSACSETDSRNNVLLLGCRTRSRGVSGSHCVSVCAYLMSPLLPLASHLPGVSECSARLTSIHALPQLSFALYFICLVSNSPPMPRYVLPRSTGILSSPPRRLACCRVWCFASVLYLTAPTDPHIPSADAPSASLCVTIRPLIPLSSRAISTLSRVNPHSTHPLYFLLPFARLLSRYLAANSQWSQY